LFAELLNIIKINSILQIIVKAVNDTAGLDNLVFILLVFSIYLYINTDSQFLPIIVKRAKAIQKIIKKLRRLRTKRQINNTLNTRNGSEITDTINFLL
jgi:hypothetical protein